MAVNSERWPSACLASGWYDRLRNLTLGFLDSTGLTMVETDGPYGGYSCSAPGHAHHAGQADSVFHQNRLQAELYKELRNRGVYINQPDTYYTQVTGTRAAPADTRHVTRGRAATRAGWAMTRSSSLCRAGWTSRCRGRLCMTAPWPSRPRRAGCSCPW